MGRSLSLLVVLLTITLRTCVPETTVEIDIEINPAVDTVLVGETHRDAGAVAFVGDENVRVTVVDNAVDTSTPGTYDIVYRARFNQQDVYIVRKVEVVEAHPLEVDLVPGIDTVVVGENWTDAGVEVIGSDAAMIDVQGDVDTDTLGVYHVVYIVQDDQGNIRRITRVVHVIDEE